MYAPVAVTYTVLVWVVTMLTVVVWVLVTSIGQISVKPYVVQVAGLLVRAAAAAASAKLQSI
jgi:hypothetical protein